MLLRATPESQRYTACVRLEGEEVSVDQAFEENTRENSTLLPAGQSCTDVTDQLEIWSCSHQTANEIQRIITLYSRETPNQVEECIGIGGKFHRLNR